MLYVTETDKPGDTYSQRTHWGPRHNDTQTHNLLKATSI